MEHNLWLTVPETFHRMWTKSNQNRIFMSSGLRLSHLSRESRDNMFLIYYEKFVKDSKKLNIGGEP